jgi:hypothetical protein
VELTCQTKKDGDQIKEGRHVGLDFYDLLIEALMASRPPTSGWSQRETGGTPCLDGRRQPSLGGTSRMNREVHVRICAIPRAYSAG